jgi:hypothetical protein
MATLAGPQGPSKYSAATAIAVIDRGSEPLFVVTIQSHTVIGRDWAFAYRCRCRTGELGSSIHLGKGLER